MVIRSVSAFIHATIRTDLVVMSCAMAGTRPAASNFTCESSDSVAAMGVGVGTAETLEVEAGGAFDPLCRHGVNIALSQDEVVLAPNLHLVAVLGVEQH